LVILEFGNRRAYAFSMKLLQILGLLVISSSEVFVDPEYPPNTVSGGTVIAEVHSVSGKVERLIIHSGEEPFVSSAKSALSQWRLHADEAGDDIVILHFRQPNLYRLGDAGEKISGAKPKRSLPYPRNIVGPAYPAQSLGQGSVILKIGISSEGRVAEIHSERSVGSLTDVSIDAVRKWDFLPAEDDRGIAKASSAYAVLVYQLPVIEQKR
jgi:hypothetical protein